MSTAASTCARVALALIAIALLLSGCGGSDDGDVSEPAKVSGATFAEGVTGPERAPLLAVQTYVTALNAGDGDTLCGLTSIDDKALTACKAEIGSGFDARTQTVYKLKSAKLIDPEHAEVRLDQVKPKPTSKATSVTLFKLEKIDGEWKTRVVGFDTP